MDLVGLQGLFLYYIVKGDDSSFSDQMSVIVEISCDAGLCVVSIDEDEIDLSVIQFAFDAAFDLRGMGIA